MSTGEKPVDTVQRPASGSSGAHPAAPAPKLEDLSKPPVFSVVDVLGWFFTLLLFWLVWLIFSESRQILRANHSTPAPAIHAPGKVADSTSEPKSYTDVSELVSKGFPAAQPTWLQSIIARIRRSFSSLRRDAGTAGLPVIGPREQEPELEDDGMQEPPEEQDLSRF